jgi:hypothetical protein
MAGLFETYVLQIRLSWTGGFHVLTDSLLVRHRDVTVDRHTEARACGLRTVADTITARASEDCGAF